MVPESVKNEPSQGLQSGTPKDGRPRSGYARLRLRFHRLVEVYERLEADHQQLQQDYKALEAAFSELKDLNASLVEDLRRLRPRAPSVPRSMGIAQTLIGGAKIVAKRLMREIAPVEFEKH